MGGMMHKAGKILQHLTEAGAKSSQGMSSYNDKVGDRLIPASLLKTAKGIAFITVIKTGVLINICAGTGIIVAKGKDGKWTGPAAIGTGGLGFGFAAGLSSTDVVLVLCTDFAVKALCSKGSVKIGGSVQLAAGPFGRDLDANIAFGNRGVAPGYSYSYSKGLYVGGTLDGAIIMPRNDCNHEYYGQGVDSLDILTGVVKPPPGPELARLHLLLEQCVDGRQAGQPAPTPDGGVAAEGAVKYDDDWETRETNPSPPAPAPPPAPTAYAADSWQEVKGDAGSYWWNTQTNVTTPVGAPKPSAAASPADNIKLGADGVNVGGVNVRYGDAVEAGRFYGENKETCDKAAKVAYENRETIAVGAKVAYENKETIAAGAATAAKYGGQAAGMFGGTTTTKK